MAMALLMSSYTCLSVLEWKKKFPVLKDILIVQHWLTEGLRDIGLGSLCWVLVWFFSSLFDSLAMTFRWDISVDVKQINNNKSS